MKETVIFILSTWEKYWGEGFYQYLLLIAVIYLLVSRRKKEATRILLPFLAVLLFVFFCPFTAELIWKCIGSDVYWRVLWAIPLIPLLAYAGAEIISSRKKTLFRAVLLVTTFGCIIVSGKSIWQAGNYEKVHNYQKVPDEVAQICNMIKEESKEKEVRLATDDYLAAYIRVYDPSILMPYSRAARGAETKKSKRFYQRVMAAVPDYTKIGKYANLLDCDYLALKLVTEDAQEKLAAQNFYKIGTVNEYSVFAQNSAE
jgi:hypothetical protein